MLKRLKVENYRSCLQTVLDCHPNLTVLIGPNSSGKTNILQAIMLLNKLTRWNEHSRREAGISSVTPVVSAVFSVGDKSATLRATLDAYTDDSNSDVLLDSTQRWRMKAATGSSVNFHRPLFLGGREQDSWAARAFGIFKYRSILQRQRYQLLESAFKHDNAPDWANEPFFAIARYCSGIRYYSASQFTNPGACPVSFEMERQGDSSRPSLLTGHALTLYAIYIAHKRDPDGRFSRFLDVVGPGGLRLIDKVEFREIKTSSIEVAVRVGGRIEKQRKQKMLVVPQFKRGRQVLSPNQLSEGTFKTIALLFNIITDDSSALLIEEPEVCVHHGLLASILELITKYSATKQMFVSTHSDYVLDHVKPENVFRVRFDRKYGTQVHHIRQTMSGREYTALRHYLEHEGNLGEYWREGGLEGNS